VSIAAITIRRRWLFLIFRTDRRARTIERRLLGGRRRRKQRDGSYEENEGPKTEDLDYHLRFVTVTAILSRAGQ
jgi:hypothetical protein